MVKFHLWRDWEERTRKRDLENMSIASHFQQLSNWPSFFLLIYETFMQTAMDTWIVKGIWEPVREGAASSPNPAGCITNYTITWDNGMFTTPDNSTSVPIDNIPELEVCRNYPFITVTPNIRAFGAIQGYTGERLHVTLLPSGTEIII